MNIPYVSQRAYFPKGSYGTFLTEADTAYALPFIPANGGFVPDQIGVRVTTQGAGANCDVRCAIYTDIGGRPGKLVHDSGLITALTSATSFTASITGALRPTLWGGKLYWLVAAFDGAASTQPTVAGLATAVLPQDITAALGVADIASIPSAVAAGAVGLKGTYTMPGAFPEYSSVSWSVVLNAVVPMVGLRAA
jgi:hypothetical protein